METFSCCTLCTLRHPSWGRFTHYCTLDHSDVYVSSITKNRLQQQQQQLRAYVLVYIMNGAH